MPIDRDLMLRFGQRGDRTAFEELVRRWDGRVYGFLAKACGDLEAADDLRQEVFLRVWRYGGSYNARFAFSTWLFRIVGNALRTWKVRNARRRRTISIDQEEAAYAEPADPSPDPRERLARSESANAVRSTIARLEVEERELLLLRFDLEMSYREIAEIKEAPESTVKSRLYTLLGRLRKDLQNAGLERLPKEM